MGQDWKTAYPFVAPVVAVLVGLVAYPFLTSIWISLTDQMVGQEAKFIGLANYLELVRMSLPSFFRVLWQTGLYTVVGVAAKFVLGLATALLLHQQLPGRNVFRALLFVPWTVPMVIGALAWRWIYSDVNGILSIGLLRLGIVKDYIYWLADPRLAMMSVMVVMIWQGMPFYTMNFLAGLQAISQDLYDAASVDGASWWQKLLHITIPGLRDVIIVTLLLSSIWTSSTLQYVYILTNGGPAYRTEIFPMLSFHISISSRDLGLGSAAALASFPFLLILILLLAPRMLEEAS